MRVTGKKPQARAATVARSRSATAKLPQIIAGTGRQLAEKPTRAITASKAGTISADAVNTVTIDETHGGQRLDNFLAAKLKGVPKSHIYRIVRSGEVRVNKGRAEVDYRLAEGDLVRIPPVRIAVPNPSTGAAFEALLGYRFSRLLVF